VSEAGAAQARESQPRESQALEYRIDDLARAAGVTVRNLRVYQDRGLLPPPRRVGRVGIYADAHLARLRLISRLLERGYSFAQIGELVSAWERGRDLADLLGLEAALTSPWTDEPARVVSALELRRLLGRQATRAALDRAVHIGLLRREGASFRVPSPTLLDAGVELVRAGVPLPTVLDLAEALSRDLDVVARRFAEVVQRQVLPAAGVEGLPAGTDLAAVAALVTRLRPLARRAVDASFAAAMERQVSTVLGEAVSAAVARARTQAQADAQAPSA